MRNVDSTLHVSGKSKYVDDIHEIEGTLYAIPVYSPIAKGKLLSLSADDEPDLIHLITAKDIPGENQIGGVIQDQELLVEETILYIGQTMAIILARNEEAAKRIRKNIKIEYIQEEAITDPRVAFKKDEIIGKPRKFVKGNVESTWSFCDLIIEGEVHIPGQEHLYLETQSSYALPTENGYKIYSSTQSPTSVQTEISNILGIPMHHIEVDVQRLGGGFGGKEEQASIFACMATLGAYISKKPVKLILDRHDDLLMTGKRHPYVAEYKIGKKDRKILAYEVIFYQDAGAVTDLSLAVLERSMFHFTSSYHIPNGKATGYSCRTNLPPNTAFRGFGGPQAMFALEVAIDNLANRAGFNTIEFQKENLINDGYEFPYGQIAKGIELQKAVAQSKESMLKLLNELTTFNSSNRYQKMGLAMFPVTFGISFSTTFLNQAGALVHIYKDGSIGVSTGAVEMGQGVNTRILQTVKQFFYLPKELIRIESTNTTRVINTSPSAASSTHDLNGKATLNACEQIRDRIFKFLDPKGSKDIRLENKFFIIDDEKIPWNDVIRDCYMNRIDLSAHGYYSTPSIKYNLDRENGHPFAYYTTGIAYVLAKVDIARGTYSLERCHIVHDSGKLLNNKLDIGQIEGGLAQGLGWLLLEDLKYSDKGELISNSLSTYKVPDIHFMPETEIEFIGSDNPLGLMGSKAVGEPPFMYGIAGYFAILNAMRCFKKMNFKYPVPLTPENIFMSLFAPSKM